MSARSRVIMAIIAKDFRLFTRDRFFFFVSILGLVFYAVLFWILPDTVDETIRVGFTGPTFGVDIGEISTADEGLELVRYEDEDALRAAIEEGDEIAIGLALPSSLSDPVITVYVGSGVPEVVSGAVEGMAREAAYSFFGTLPPVSGFNIREIEVLGNDRVGVVLVRGPLLLSSRSRRSAVCRRVPSRGRHVNPAKRTNRSRRLRPSKTCATTSPPDRNVHEQAIVRAARPMVRTRP